MKIFKRILLSIVIVVVIAAMYPAYLLLSGKFVVGDFAMVMNAVVGKGIVTPAEAVVQQRLQVPAGYKITTWARDLPQVRFLRVTTAGDLIASRPRAGEVVLFSADKNDDGQPDEKRILLSGLQRPHGIDFYQDWLYVAESNAIGRIKFDHATGKTSGEYQRILTGIGEDGGHWTKSLRISADGWIYLSSGSTCNVCVEEDPHRAAISRLRADGSQYKVYASGLRNSVGLDFNPADNQLYATDNGRDLLGDDIPPCELNRIVENGFYGFPYRYGNNVKDPEFGDQGGEQAAKAIPPVHGFRAHNAPLGMHFLRHAIPGFPQNTALVALHGSWNRSTPDGYKVVALRFQPDGSVKEEPFMTGFEENGNVIGRPVDVAQGPNGEIYVSDDYAGAIYRVTSETAGDKLQRTNNVTAQQPVPVSIELAPVSEEVLAQGAQVWKRYACANCHGVEPGKSGLKSLKDLSQRYDQSSLAMFFLAPTPPMPRVPLSDEEREAVAAWLLRSEAR
jgi:glucose/arabinose dehydrogenase/cytochrome c551/c552